MIRKGKSKLTILTHIKSKTKKENSELQELYNLAIYSISDMFSDSNELIKIETKARYEYIIEKCLKQDLPSGFEVARKTIQDLLRISLKEDSKDILKELEYEFNLINNSNPQLSILITAAKEFLNKEIDVQEFQEKADIYFKSNEVEIE